MRDERVEASQMRKAIARRLSESIGPVPHFYLTIEVDMERALDMRSELNARAKDFKIGVNDVLLKTAAEALVRHPQVTPSSSMAAWTSGSRWRWTAASSRLSCAMRTERGFG